MKIALAQIRLEPGNYNFNLAKISDYTKQAASKGCELVVFPELADHGYNPEMIRKLSADFTSSKNELFKIAADNNVNLACGFLEKDRETLYNSFLLANRLGEQIAIYRKGHLIEIEPLCEHKSFVPGNQNQTCKIDDVTAGISICYDIRFPELYRNQRKQNAEILINTSCWPESRLNNWLNLAKARAIENQCFFIGCASVGDYIGFELSGNSIVVSPTGEVITQAGTEEELLISEIDLNEVSKIRETFNTYKSASFSFSP